MTGNTDDRFQDCFYCDGAHSEEDCPNRLEVREPKHKKPSPSKGLLKVTQSSEPKNEVVACPHCHPEKFPQTGTPLYGCSCICHKAAPQTEPKDELKSLNQYVLEVHDDKWVMRGDFWAAFEALLSNEVLEGQLKLLTPTDKKYIEAAKLWRDDRSMPYIAKKLGYKHASGVDWLLKHYPRRGILEFLIKEK